MGRPRKIEKFLKPSEIVISNRLTWTPNDIGNLFRLKLIRGRKLLRGCEVSETDVLKIYKKRFFERLPKKK